MVQNNLLRNFWIKDWDCRDWTNVWKSCKKLARWQEKAKALKAYRLFFVFYSVIFIHKLNIIKKKYVICLHIFSAAILPNIIKIGEHLTE